MLSYVAMESLGRVLVWGSALHRSAFLEYLLVAAWRVHCGDANGRRRSRRGRGSDSGETGQLGQGGTACSVFFNHL